MLSTKEIAQDISILMPIIARRILLEFFEKNDIPQTQIFTIMALYAHEGPCRLTDISKEMHISAPTTTGIVDRLEKSKYVKRVPDQNDRRAINVELTEKGKKLAKVFREMLVKRWSEVLGEISEVDRNNFLSILKKIRGVIQ